MDHKYPSKAVETLLGSMIHGAGLLLMGGGFGEDNFFKRQWRQASGTRKLPVPKASAPPRPKPL